MTLLICDNGSRREVPASIEAVELTFGPGVRYADGAQITLADGDRWLMAFALAEEGDPKEFFISGNLGDAWALADRVERREALRQFRRFLEAA